MKKLYYVLLLGLLWSCNQIPKEKRLNYIKIPKDIETNINLLNNNIKRVSDFKKLNPYLKSIDMSTFFEKSLKQLVQSKEIYDSKMTKLIEENHKKHIPSLDRYNKEIRSKIRNAKDLYVKPINTLVLYRNIYEKKDEYLKIVDNINNNSSSMNNKLLSMRKVYIKKFPKKEKKINNEYVKFEKTYNSLIVDVKSLHTYYGDIKKNINIIGKLYTNIQTQYKVIKDENNRLKLKLVQLDKSYTKILKDIDIDFFVQIGETTWDNDSDWNTDKNKVFKLKLVDEETYNYFDNLPDNTVLATIGKGWNGTYIKPRIEKKYWNKATSGLNILYGIKTYSGHDDGEVWLNTIDEEYKHQYQYIINGNVIKTVWEEVDEETFLVNIDNIGMSLTTKPYGMFEDEAVNSAHPAGLEYVGNEKYGKWKKDDNGNEFWEFYGKWMFFNTLMGNNHYYSRSYYNDYNDNYRYRKPYYGTGGRYYGTRGRYYTNSSSYKTSRYNRNFANNSRSTFNKTKLTTISNQNKSRIARASSRKGSSRRGGGTSSGK